MELCLKQSAFWKIFKALRNAAIPQMTGKFKLWVGVIIFIEKSLAFLLNWFPLKMRCCCNVPESGWKLAKKCIPLICVFFSLGEYHTEPKSKESVHLHPLYCQQILKAIRIMI